MIEVKDLVKKYGDHVAVDHLTFTVEKRTDLWFPWTQRCREIHNHEYYDRIYRRHGRRSAHRRT